MYIEPNTTIKFYKNIGIDSNYINTLRFKTRAEQNNFFHSVPNSKLILSLPNNTYQRVDKKMLRVAVGADVLYGCDYIAFQNASFNNKWFYAFVTSVNYISNSVCELYYEIDTIQTYLLDCTINHCFVEREHSRTDNVGDNILNEGFNTDTVINNEVFEKYITSSTWKCCIQYVDSNKEERHVIFNSDLNLPLGVKGVYSLDLSETAINNRIDSIVNNGGEIVNVYIAPYFYYLPYDYGEELQYVFKSTDFAKTLDGYIPKNNKMYTYPYNYLNLYSSDGGNKDYRFEFLKWYDIIDPITQEFISRNFMFKHYGNAVNKSEGICVPEGYEGLDNYSIQNGVWLKNFPLCSWADNSYQEYIAREATNDAISIGINSLSNVVGGGISLIGGLQTANPIMAIRGGANILTGALTESASMVNNISKLEKQPNDLKNQSSAHYLLRKLDKIGFVFTRKSVNKEVAKSIDNFFSCYGYMTSELKIPNLFDGGSVRPHWNYLKTKSCNIIGSCPADEIKTIQTIFNNGITFWNSNDIIGNYGLDNSPL